MKKIKKGIDKYIFFCYNYSRGKEKPQKIAERQKIGDFENDIEED